MKMGKRLLSEVGFEPTPSFEDQNTHFSEAKSLSLESGALDRSAILTLLRKDGEIEKIFDFWFLGYGEQIKKTKGITILVSLEG